MFALEHCEYATKFPIAQY